MISPYAKGYQAGLNGDTWSTEKFETKLAKIAYHHGYRNGHADREKEKHGEPATA